jgi:hypothetical protein
LSLEGDTIQGHGQSTGSHVLGESVGDVADVVRCHTWGVHEVLVLSDAEGDIISKEVGVNVLRLYLVSCGCVSSPVKLERNSSGPPQALRSSKIGHLDR